MAHRTVKTAQNTEQHVQRVTLDSGVTFERVVRCDPTLDILFENDPGFVKAMRDLGFEHMIDLRVAGTLPPHHPIWQRVVDPSHRETLALLSGLVPLTPSQREARDEQLAEALAIEAAFTEIADSTRRDELAVLRVPNVCVACGHMGHKLSECAVRPNEIPYIRAARVNAMNR